MISFGQAASTEARFLLEELKTSPDGLSASGIAQRLKSFGKNAYGQKKKTARQIFARQFKNAFLYLLVGASLVSFFLGQAHQALVIMAIVWLTAFLGFFLEFRSQKAEEKLASFLRETCWVRRKGEKERVDKVDLVPGDLVLIQTGDVVPADCRLIKQDDLLVDESALTGESVPVRKVVVKQTKAETVAEARNLLFAGTTIQSGDAEAVVFATGKATQIGKISGLVGQTSAQSSFEKTLKLTANFILRLTIIALAVTFISNLMIKGSGANVPELLLFTIALAVGIVPEALPVVSLFTMSLGALALAKKKVIVKRLTALEDLGNVQVLCIDKTGTLTENKLSVGEIFSFSQNEFWKYFLAAVQATLNAKGVSRSYLDQVIYERGLQLGKVLPQDQILHYESFDPKLRRDRTLVRVGSECLLISKGAPETILKLCTFETERGQKRPLDLKHWQELLVAEGRRGRRTYALAVKKVPDSKSDLLKSENDLTVQEEKMVFMGLVSFYDPIKKTAAMAAQKASKLGVMVKILTGDSAPVAGWVAKEIGLIENQKEVIEGGDLEKMNPEELEKAVFSGLVFARVSPEQKYQIVKILQKKYWTAFLGDGINDAPSLKLANVSLAVNSAAEVAKAASDVILLRKDLQVILVGIEQGRRIFSNVIKYIQYTLASNFGNSYSLALISLLLPFLPMLPAQILLVNLLSDFPLILVATDTVDASQVRRPVNFNLRQSGVLIVFLGFISIIFDFLFFAVFRLQPASVLQTLWFIESVLSENIFILSIRSRLPFWRAVRPSWPLLTLLIVTTVTAVVIPYSFLSGSLSFAKPAFSQIGLVLLIVFGYFATTETAKIIYYHSFDRKNQD